MEKRYQVKLPLSSSNSGTPGGSTQTDQTSTSTTMTRACPRCLTKLGATVDLCFGCGQWVPL
jgi:hypothetical protein